MAERGTRSGYRAFREMGTRWADNDAYGHMNNVVHYSLFDTAVNGWMIAGGFPRHPGRGGGGPGRRRRGAGTLPRWGFPTW